MIYLRLTVGPWLWTSLATMIGGVEQWMVRLARDRSVVQDPSQAPVVSLSKKLYF